MTTPSSATIASSIRGELAVVRLAGAHSTLEAALQGAHVTDWTLPGTPPVLFLSPRSGFVRGKAIRGGIPLVFPWFGPKTGDPAAAQHGFARVRDWKLLSALEGSGAADLTFELTDDEVMRTAWPHPFRARLSLTAGWQLRLALEIRNTGADAFTCEAALHTYLAVSDVRRILVHGLENTGYVDKAGGNVPAWQGESALAFSGETDRLYLDTASACTVEDPGWKRRIVIAKSGSRSTVVWNPWLEKARAMSDLGDAAWTGMVCIETVNAGDDARTLAPGATHVLEAVISVEID